MLTDKIKIEVNDPIKAKKVPAVLTIAGSDSSGGAGIEADLKTLSAHGVYGLTCIAALTAQNTCKVFGIHEIPEEFLEKMLKANLEDFLLNYNDTDHPLKVIKTGMLTVSAIKIIIKNLKLLKQNAVQLVLDPVMISTSGATLFKDDAMSLCVRELIPHASLVTPNYEETKALFQMVRGKDFKLEIESSSKFAEIAKDLQQVLKSDNVLIKGGHLAWDPKHDKPFHGDPMEEKGLAMLDVLYESKEDRVTIFRSDYLPIKDSHGSGCTLASAIAANLAKGKPMVESVGLAIDYVHKCMSGFATKMGKGNGPLNHNIVPARFLSEVSNGNAATCDEGSDLESHELLDYLISHPKVHENWLKYINHPFVRDVATYKLPFEKFTQYIQQDYHYLITYARIQALAASKTKDPKLLIGQANSIGEISKELDRHAQTLSTRYNVEFDVNDSSTGPLDACRAYCSYLQIIGEEESFLGTKIALAPCLHGYFQAGKIAVGIHQEHKKRFKPEETPISKIYDSWLSDYYSDWFSESDKAGKRSLERAFSIEKNAGLINRARLEKFVDVFNDVVLLEIKFWDEAYYMNEQT